MRRALILATLICILFAVAGVTVAGENTFTSSSRDGDQTESTVAGRIAPEATVPETTVPEEVEKPVEGTEEAAVVVHEEPKEPGRGDPGAGNYGGIQDGNSIDKVVEKPQRAQSGKKYGKPRVAGKPPGKSRLATGRPDHAGEKGYDGNPGKVTVCHKSDKNRITISVGAPAKPAHLRHRHPRGLLTPTDARAGSCALLALTARLRCRAGYDSGLGFAVTEKILSFAIASFARKLILFEDTVNGCC